MKVYKLFNLRKNGTLGPLFINRRQVIPLNKWLQAENHPTKGFKERQGWHTVQKQEAEHLSEIGRVWCECEVQDYYEYPRPRNQGGSWIIAQKIKVNKICNS